MKGRMISAEREDIKAAWSVCCKLKVGLRYGIKYVTPPHNVASNGERLREK